MFVLIFAIQAVFRGVRGIPLDPPASNELDPRIHGGVDAPPGYAPHMAALLTGEHRVLVVGGGSIVTRRHILTAAHCITPFVEKDGKLAPTFHGRVGSNIWHSGGLLVHFQAHFVHPKWDESIIKYDVGVLFMAEQIELNDKVAVIGLNFKWIGGDERSYVTGWGRTGPRFEENVVHLAPTPDSLQLLYVATLTPEQCAAGIQASHHWAIIAPPLNPSVEICTFHSIGHGMCQGDSGSALVSIATGLQVGVVSWGMPCAVGAPDIYTRLSGVVENFLRPILETAEGFSSGPDTISNN